MRQSGMGTKAIVAYEHAAATSTRPLWREIHKQSSSPADDRHARSAMTFKALHVEDFKPAR